MMKDETTHGHRWPYPIAILAMWVTLPLTSAGSLSVVSTDAAGNLGDADSGHLALPIWYQTLDNWITSPTTADGNVFFLSLADSITGFDETTGPGPGDVDVFFRASGADVAAVSMANPGFPLGDAREIAVFQSPTVSSALVVEIRDEDASDEHRQKLFYHPSSDSVPVELVLSPDLDQFRHVRVAGEGNTACLVLVARDVDQAGAVFNVYRQRFAFAGAPLSRWTAVGAPAQLTAETTDDCAYPDTSADGAENLWQVGGDILFLQDAESVHVNITASIPNACSAPVFSGDGSTIYYVVFADSARKTLWRYDIASQTAIPVGSTDANGESTSPACSRTGQIAVFSSSSTILSADVKNGNKQIYVYYADTGQIEAISRSATGDPADGDCVNPAMSPNGRYITFSSKATNLVPGAANGEYQVFLYDRGDTFATNHPPTVGWLRVRRQTSTATCRVTMEATDREGGTLQYRLAAAPQHGALTDSNGDPLLAWFAADRLPLTYTAYDPDSNDRDAFIYQVRDASGAIAAAAAAVEVADFVNGRITLLTADAAGIESGRSSPYWNNDYISIDQDGRWLAFTRQVAVDNGFGSSVLRKALYLRNCQADACFLLWTTESNNMVNPIPVMVAANGNAVVFSATSLGGDGSQVRNVYWCPLTLTAPDAAGMREQDAPGNQTVSLSADGSVVAYDRSGELDGHDIRVWRPAISQVSTVAEGVLGRPVVSPTGSAMAFLLNEETIRLRTADAAGDFGAGGLQDLGDPSGALADISISRTGRFVAYQAGTVVKVVDFMSAGGPGQVASMALAEEPFLASGGGHLYLVGVPENIEPQAAAGKLNRDKKQAYRYGIKDGTLTLLSRTADGGYAAADSYRGMIATAGNLAVFASDAQLSNDDNNVRDILMADFGEPQEDVPPVADDVPVGTHLVDQGPDTSLLLQLAGTDSNSYDQDLTFVIETQPEHGSLQFYYAPGLPWVVYAPDPNWFGEDSFSYRCWDSRSGSAPATVAITVTHVNALPRWIDVPVLWRTQPGEPFILDLSRFVDDPDTQNPEPDILHFSLLQGAPEVRINGNTLTVSEAAVIGPEPIVFRLGVADREDGPVIELGEELAIHVRAPVEIPLTTGWNLISVPMTPEPSDPALLLTGPWDTGAERLYLGPAWYWDAETACYRSAETLEPKRGYWVYCPESASVSMQVAWLPLVDPAVELVPGWNLVGPVGFGEVASPTVVATGVQIPPESIWLWDGEVYANPEQNVIRCGDGTWIYSIIDQIVNIELEPPE